jgi:hypothetical protein
VPDIETIDIRSTVTDTGQAACLLQWADNAALLDPTVVLNTARDLHTAAARAETDIATMHVLRNKVGMDWHGAAAMVADIRTARPMSSGKVALRIEAIAGAKTGLPYVHIHRGSLSSSMSPDVAREMATNWIEVAVAAQLDVRLRYVLGEYDQLTPGDIEDVFTSLRRVGGMGD